MSAFGMADRLLSEDPTAHTNGSDAATPWSTSMYEPGFGVAATIHFVPVQRMISVRGSGPDRYEASSRVPTAQTPPSVVRPDTSDKSTVVRELAFGIRSLVQVPSS